MARNVGDSRTGIKKEDNCSSDGTNVSDGVQTGEKKKSRVNSWDRSSSDANGSTPKSRHSDWDSSSDPRETMVEPFDIKTKGNDDDRDSDLDEIDAMINDQHPIEKPVSRSPNSFVPMNLSMFDNPSEVNKNSLFDMFNVKSGQSKTSKNHQEVTIKDFGDGYYQKDEEDSLMIEDIEEFQKGENAEEQSENVFDSHSESGKLSLHSRGTADDTTIWMIPKSDRSSSAASISKLITVSERETLDTLNRVHFNVKKAKSSSSMDKEHRRKSAAKSSRSDCLSNVKRGDLSHWEGSSFQKKLKLRSPHKADRVSEKIDESRVYFTEYECRTVTMNNSMTRKTSVAVVSNEEDETSTRLGVEGAEIDNISTRNENINADGGSPDEDDHHSTAMAGPSMQASLEVVSLPDIIGHKDRRVKEKMMRRINNSGESRNETDSNNQAHVELRNESWFLLDETGQYQAVTRNEVTILLNGRSTEAVLQGHKEHFIQSPTISNMRNQNGSWDGMPTKESIQNILREEDMGGEGHDRKCIDLERKVENTLLYIQPGINLTASIRIIPVETEMIHIWRRSRDNGSLISSEVDLRLQSSQDSVDNPNVRTMNDHYLRRINLEKTQQTVAEQDENAEANIDHTAIEVRKQENPLFDYSKLLIETRIIVDNLTNSITVLQNRLDGETNRCNALQEEVQKLRHLLKEPEEKKTDKDREAPCQHHRSNVSCYSSVTSLLVERQEKDGDDISANNERSVSLNAISEKVSLEKNEADFETQSYDSKNSQDTINGKARADDYITVNIYTTSEEAPHCNMAEVQETNSLLQTNLGIIEGKMKRLEEENTATPSIVDRLRLDVAWNEVITRQNSELKKKLREISVELEKYLASTTEADACLEEDRDMDTLRDQVCNLKLELDNLKKTAKEQEREMKIENALMKEELRNSSISLEEWLTMSDQVIREVENLKSKLADIGILNEEVFHLDGAVDSSEPRSVSFCLSSFIRRVTGRLIAVQNENLLYEKAFEKSLVKDSLRGTPDGFRSNNNAQKDVLNRVISGYNNLIEQCQKGLMSSGDQVLDDYFAIIMEKASLLEEIKILKTENEMLIQDQLNHHEKLKQTMIALKDRKEEIEALQSAQKLSEEEKNRMTEILRSYEEQKMNMEKELAESNARVEELMKEIKTQLDELDRTNAKLEAATKEIENIEKSCRMKDDLINECKMENEQLLRLDEIKKNQLEVLKVEINELEIQRTQLDSEITSLKLNKNESEKEMTEYISHLESIVNSGQDALDKNKQKLKDTSQMMARLQTENEALERRYQCDLKLYNKTKEELDACKDKVTNLSNKFRQVDEEREKLREKLEALASAEKKTSEALDLATKECKILQTENNTLKERIEIYSKDRDESLKEQKDLINKYAIISKELQKLQDKYRHVKAECNERTNVIKYLETLLKENAVDYNNKIAYLENNITHILDKIAACKYSIREKHGGVDAEVRELREQLNVTHRERKELENVVNNYYSAMKRLKSEVQDREKEVDELHVRLTREQQKWAENSQLMTPAKQVKEEETRKCSESVKTEHLEIRLTTAENELAETKKKLKQTETNHENEKKKLELTIADLKSEINRYQLRIEVMMKNLSNCNKNINIHNFEKRNAEEITRKLHITAKDMEAKDEKIAELIECIDQHKAEFKLKESEMETLKKKNYCMSEMLKNLQNHLSKMETALSMTNKTSERQQKEKNEMAEKLLQSIKIIMEEKSARQSIELLSVEKEKTFKEQLDHLRSELEEKVRCCSALSEEVEEKKKLIFKLQHDFKKIKLENASLKAQALKANENSIICKDMLQEEMLQRSNSVTYMKFKNLSPERLESCMRELKEIRDVNLMLRKSEGEYQAKIVRLEDDVRDARIMIKELEGGIKIEKKSKKALKNMIMSAKMEINRCLVEKQILSVVADRITRHLDLDELQSRGFLSRDIRRSNSSESYS